MAGMNKSHRIVGALLACSLLSPALAVAQATTSSSTVDSQVQSLLSQIAALQQQLRSLIQTVAPSSTHERDDGNNATTTPQNGGPGGPKSDCSVFNRNLSEGSQGDDVKQLQQTLSDNGFFNASSTGFFGPLTARALMQFQLHFGIASSSSANGFFGPLTRNFFGGRCGNGKGPGGDGQGKRPGDGHMGTSTWPMAPGQNGQWQNGTSTWGQNGTSTWGGGGSHGTST